MKGETFEIMYLCLPDSDEGICGREENDYFRMMGTRGSGFGIREMSNRLDALRLWENISEVRLSSKSRFLGSVFGMKKKGVEK